MTSYFKLSVDSSGEQAQELLIAQMHLYTNFESVEQQDSKLIFSFHVDNDTKENVHEALLALEISGKIEDEEEKNWNEIYEKSFQPILLDDNSWGVRASFHEKLTTQNEIVIDPKMSFGTGHHETTYQMMARIAGLNIKGKKVWDYGSGTGILAILAEKMGAEWVLGNDNESWAYQNSLENASLNGCQNVHFFEGDIAKCEQGGFLIPDKHKMDVIIANITKNILLDTSFEISQYAQQNTTLLLSGFYEQDIDDIVQGFEKHGFIHKDTSVRNQWACLEMQKL
jgi:ribosomal protein L11 methyltransferase